MFKSVFLISFFSSLVFGASVEDSGFAFSKLSNGEGVYVRGEFSSYYCTQDKKMSDNNAHCVASIRTKSGFYHLRFGTTYESSFKGMSNGTPVSYSCNWNDQYKRLESCY